VGDAAQALSHCQLAGPDLWLLSCTMTKISYAGYRFPPEIIEQAIWLYVRFTLSANSDASRPGIPISFRPPFRIDAGHHSELKPAT
jgi:hypothetical protein